MKISLKKEVSDKTYWTSSKHNCFFSRPLSIHTKCCFHYKRWLSYCVFFTVSKCSSRGSCSNRRQISPGPFFWRSWKKYSNPLTSMRNGKNDKKRSGDSDHFKYREIPQRPENSDGTRNKTHQTRERYHRTQNCGVY